MKNRKEYIAKKFGEKVNVISYVDTICGFLFVACVLIGFVGLMNINLGRAIVALVFGIN